jgi:Phage integrase, N-terminal SAM-like domain
VDNVVWVEQHHHRYRVRYRVGGRCVSSGSYDTAEAACVFAARLNNLNREVKRRLSPAPPPTLTEWVITWLPAHAAGAATIARYESILHTHLLPAFGGHRLDAITRTDVKASTRDLAARRSPQTVAASPPYSG